MSPTSQMTASSNRAALLAAIALLAVGRLHAQALAIESRIEAGPWSPARAIYPLHGQGVSLRIAPRPAAEVRWFRIVPNIVTLYHNAEWPWSESDAYAWRGFDPIGYHRLEIDTWHGRWQVTLDTRAGFPSAARLPWPGRDSSALVGSPEHYRHDLGSFWYQAEITRSGQTVGRSPGIEASDRRGLSPQVLRVSIRESDSYIGWLSSFYNVPAIFGSTPYQSANYIGVDCADVLMAAFERSRGRAITQDHNVAALVSLLRVVARAKLERGEPDRVLTWGQTLTPGDLIAVRYNGQRVFQHIGALYRDASANGRLDAGDLVLHVGPEPLHVSPLSAGGFDGDVVILRLAKP